MDHPRLTWIGFQFPPQPRDPHINAAIENVLMDTCRLQQVFPCERPLRCFEKRHQQGILALAQRDRSFMRIYESSAATLKPPATESVAAASFRTAGSGGTRHPPSAQNGMGTCEQFPEAKRLDDVVVCTEFEADDTIRFVKAVPSHDDWNI